MGNWKTWVFVIAIYLTVKMCGGCNACSDKGGGNGQLQDIRSTNISELKTIIEKSGTITDDEAKCLVISHILNTMKNPNSYEPVSWGDLVKMRSKMEDGVEYGGGWHIEHTFRGTNSYGGVVTETHVYIIHRDGWVTSGGY